MIDIHNKAHAAWCGVGDETKAEIYRQESLGAIVNAWSYSLVGWVLSKLPRDHEDRSFGVYRIQLGTEAPAPNMIEREGNLPISASSKFVLWQALRSAHTLIATMSGGNPELRKAYDEAIK